MQHVHVLGEARLDVGHHRPQKRGVDFASPREERIAPVPKHHAAAVRRGFARQERLRVRLERALELGAFAAVQHVVPDLLRGEHLAGEVVRELAAHLRLSLQKQTLDLQLFVPEQVHRVHRLEDALERDPVRGEAHQRAPERQRPGVVVEQPRRRLDAPQQEPEEQARVCQKRELLAPALLEQLHEHALVFAHLLHHQLLQVHQPVRLALHELNKPGQVPRDAVLQPRDERAALRGHRPRAEVRRPPRRKVSRDVARHLGNLRREEARHLRRVQAQERLLHVDQLGGDHLDHGHGHLRRLRGDDALPPEGAQGVQNRVAVHVALHRLGQRHAQERDRVEDHLHRQPVGEPAHERGHDGDEQDTLRVRRVLGSRARERAAPPGQTLGIERRRRPRRAHRLVSERGGGCRILLFQIIRVRDPRAFTVQRREKPQNRDVRRLDIHLERRGQSRTEHENDTNSDADARAQRLRSRARRATGDDAVRRRAREKHAGEPFRRRGRERDALVVHPVRRRGAVQHDHRRHDERRARQETVPRRGDGAARGERVLLSGRLERLLLPGVGPVGVGVVAAERERPGRARRVGPTAATGVASVGERRDASGRRGGRARDDATSRVDAVVGDARNASANPSCF